MMILRGSPSECRPIPAMIKRGIWVLQLIKGYSGKIFARWHPGYYDILPIWEVNEVIAYTRQWYVYLFGSGWWGRYPLRLSFVPFCGFGQLFCFSVNTTKCQSNIELLLGSIKLTWTECGNIGLLNRWNALLFMIKLVIYILTSSSSAIFYKLIIFLQ